MAGAAVFDDASSEFLRSSAPSWTTFPASIAAWIKLDSAFSAQGGVVALCGSGTRNFSFYVTSSDVLKGYIRIGGGASVVLTGTTLNKDQWYFVAHVSASHTDHILYLDGAVDQTSTVDSTGTDTFDRVRIGCWTSETGQFFDGSIAYVHYYDRALSIGEVNQIMHCPGSVVDNLQVYYPLIEDASVTTDYKDLSPSSQSITAGTLPSPSLAGPPVYFPQAGSIR